MSYGKTIEIDLPMETAVPKVKEAFKLQGFGTLTEIDMAATLKEKIGQVIDPYVILGMCNPNLASQALAVEIQIGLLLPCNVVVRRQDARTLVEALDPAVMVGVPDNEMMRPIAEDAGASIDRALEALVR
ncbi:MAG: DUF302 domain-containing protein [Actinomycetota bacterium]